MIRRLDEQVLAAIGPEAAPLADVPCDDARLQVFISPPLNGLNCSVKACCNGASMK
jgi:hypothetical protein